MSAVALLLAPSASLFSVGVVNAGGNAGFVRDVFGSITPSSFRGALQINQMFSDTTSPAWDLSLVIGGAGMTQNNAFSSLLVETAPGVFRQLRAADASTFQDFVTAAEWRWGTGSSPVWDASDGGTTRLALFHY